MQAASESVTELLALMGQGDREAETRLLALVYPELRRLAGAYMRRERAGHTLQPTALVNEAFMRLSGEPRGGWQDRAHFIAVSAQAMRRVLVDHARAKAARKRGGEDLRIPFIEAEVAGEGDGLETLAIHEALERLARLNERQARVVEMKYFGGMSWEEIALVLGVSERTAKRDWEAARAWLHAQLGGA
ncbi:MAG TPA: sigma-70 family RNA polymerase sigma factor [Bryobacteraceae bacterium]|nr:sigma-70 family RNA polymerase sigma factor [Bryobacteraceae bacterium]